MFFGLEMDNSLKPKGILVLVLPIEKNEIIRQFKPTKSQHLFAWTFQTINQLLYSAKFKIRLNRLNYVSGYSVFYILPFKLALFCLKIAGRIRNNKEMIIVAEKS